MTEDNGKRYTGRTKWFNTTKGFGFIVPSEESQLGADVFVHYSAISGTGYRSLNEGDEVEFSVERSKKGLHAKEVTVL